MTPRAEMKLFLLLVAPNTAEKVPSEKKTVPKVNGKNCTGSANWIIGHLPARSVLNSERDMNAHSVGIVSRIPP